MKNQKSLNYREEHLLARADEIKKILPETGDTNKKFELLEELTEINEELAIINRNN